MDSITESIEGSRTSTEGNPHVLSRQLTGLVFWVALFSFVSGGIYGLMLGLALASATFADAWVSGIYKDPSKESFLNISPMGWGIVVSALFVIGYPAYLFSRNRLKTKQGGDAYFVATVALGVVLIILLGLSFIEPSAAVG